MHADLLDILADPETGAPLTLEVTRREGEVIEEGLLRAPSGRVYPITKGIPRFVDPDTYADNFGLQWNRFRAAQLDTAAGGSISRQRFDTETGWTSDDALRGKWVLDAGCGAGRFAEVAAKRGARLVALDLSSAVEATAETLVGYENVDVVQASLLAPPFRDGAFDRAYCIGVVQHTPDPPRVIQNVVRCVRAGGSFAFTIYGRRPWTKLNGKYIVRHVTRRLPPETLLRAVERTMPVVFPIADKLFGLPGIGAVTRFVTPVAVYPEQSRPGWDRERRYRESVLDTFDMLAPRYDSPMTADEVRDALVAAGAAEHRFVSRIPVNVVGTR